MLSTGIKVNKNEKSGNKGRNKANVVFITSINAGGKNERSDKIRNKTRLMFILKQLIQNVKRYGKD